MGPITPVSAQIAPVSPPGASPKAAPGEFQNLLSTSIQSVEADRTNSREAVRAFLAGESDDVHKVAIAAQRAELSAELFIQMRNKVVSAYQEIMKMQM
jgi:flagellar hook-basal body complex protein FliE